MTRGLRQLDPRSLFPVLAVAIGLPVVFLTPPFQSPDEPAHFLRAWALSEGRLLADTTPRAAGSELPASLLELQHLTMKSPPGEPFLRIDASDLQVAWSLRTSQERVFLDYTTAAVFPPFVYLPQAAGIALARPFGRPLLALWLGRCGNLAAGIVLGWLALRLAPRGRWTLFAIALLPMATAIRSSLSADVVTMGLAWLLIAATLRLAGGGALPRAGWFPLLAFLLGTAKLAYTPLGLAAAAAAWEKSRRASASIALAAALGLLLSLTWSQAWRPVRADVTTSPSLQLQALRADPSPALVAIVADPVAHAPRYIAEMIGRLGWLDVPLPLSYLAVTAVFLLVVSFREERAGSWTLRALLAGAAALSGFLVVLSQYLAWTPVGAHFVEGTAGRYFLPIAPAVLIALSSGDETPERIAWLPVVWALLTAALLLTVLARFYWQ